MAFRVPTRVVIEPGSLGRLGELAAGTGARRATLVTDPGLSATRWPEAAAAGLREAGVEVSAFDAVEANPRAATVERMAADLVEWGGDLVVGLGGGSALDAAKAAAMLATNGGRSQDYAGAERFSRPPLPFIAIPTTCGTGSEVTWVSVITVEEERTKISVKGEGMFPDHALVDADLLATLPSRLVAWTGLDALTHALEAITGRRANPASDALAERAVGLVFRYLRRAAADVAGDGEARRGMAEASTLAGLAFGNADVGPVHCLSETLGGLYDVPHGLTNGLLLAPVLRSHGASVRDRLAALAPAVVPDADRSDPDSAAGGVLTAIEALVADLSLPPFSSFEIPSRDHAEIGRRAEANGSNPSSPRPMAAADYVEILRRLD